MTTPARTKRIAAAVCVAAFLAQALAFHSLRHDDAYITYRYGQNLARGRGPVFNPGERVLGATAPLHMLLSGAVEAIAGDAPTPSIMSALGCAGWTLQGLFVFLLLADAAGVGVAAVAAAAILCGIAGSATWVALETNLVAALVSLSMWLALRRKWLGTAAACALATLTRPDAALAALPLGLLCVLELRARAWKPALLGAAMLAPWVIFATLFYGSPVPQTLATKMGMTQFVPYLLHLLAQPLEAMGLPQQWLAAALAWLLAGIGARKLWLLDRRLAILPAYALLHAAVYLWLRPPNGHTWHLYPLVWPFAVCAVVGVADLLQRAKVGRGLSRALAAAFVLVLLLRTAAFAREQSTDRWLGARDEIYRRVASYLLQQSKPGDVFSASEVGTIAWLTDLTANDEARLVTRDPEMRWRNHSLRWAITGYQEDFAKMGPRAPGAKMVVFEGREGSTWRVAVIDLRTAR